MFVDLVAKHGCLDIFVPHESHVKKAMDAVQRECFEYPNADVLVHVGDVDPQEQEGRPSVWFWSSEGKKVGYEPKEVPRPPTRKMLPTGRVKKLSQILEKKDG